MFEAFCPVPNYMSLRLSLLHCSVVFWLSIQVYGFLGDDFQNVIGHKPSRSLSRNESVAFVACGLTFVFNLHVVSGAYKPLQRLCLPFRSM